MYAHAHKCVFREACQLHPQVPPHAPHLIEAWSPLFSSMPALFWFSSHCLATVAIHHQDFQSFVTPDMVKIRQGGLVFYPFISEINHNSKLTEALNGINKKREMSNTHPIRHVFGIIMEWTGADVTHSDWISLHNLGEEKVDLPCECISK